MCSIYLRETLSTAAVEPEIVWNEDFLLDVCTRVGAAAGLTIATDGGRETIGADDETRNMMD